jgi:hypothetical protein
MTISNPTNGGIHPIQSPETKYTSVHTTDANKPSASLPPVHFHFQETNQSTAKVADTYVPVNTQPPPPPAKATTVQATATVPATMSSAQIMHTHTNSISQNNASTVRNTPPPLPCRSSAPPIPNRPSSTGNADPAGVIVHM